MTKKEFTSDIDKIRASRMRLILSNTSEFTFFAHLATKFELVPGNHVRGLFTDGHRLIYNQQEIEKLPDKIIDFLLARAIMHCVLGHHERRKNRHSGLWNLACAFAVHCVLFETNVWHTQFALPGSDKFSWLPFGEYAERYYDILQDLVENLQKMGLDPENLVCDDQKLDMDWMNNELPIIGLLDRTNTEAGSEADWKASAVRALNAAKTRGTMPGSLCSAIESAIYIPLDYEKLLAHYLCQIVGYQDDDWNIPDRRSETLGVYLPGSIDRALETVVIFVDTSGSMTEDEDLRICAGQIEQLLTYCNTTAYIVQHDADIQSVTVWEPGDSPLVTVFQGRGGTSHVPAWDWLKKSGVDPDAVIAITDGYTEFGEDPKIPVIWIFTPSANKANIPPFGNAVWLPSKRNLA